MYIPILLLTLIDIKLKNDVYTKQNSKNSVSSTTQFILSYKFINKPKRKLLSYFKE